MFNSPSKQPSYYVVEGYRKSVDNHKEAQALCEKYNSPTCKKFFDKKVADDFANGGTLPERYKNKKFYVIEFLSRENGRFGVFYDDWACLLRTYPMSGRKRYKGCDTEELAVTTLRTWGASAQEAASLLKACKEKIICAETNCTADGSVIDEKSTSCGSFAGVDCPDREHKVEIGSSSFIAVGRSLGDNKLTSLGASRRIGAVGGSDPVDENLPKRTVVALESLAASVREINVLVFNLLIEMDGSIPNESDECSLQQRTVFALEKIASNVAELAALARTQALHGADEEQELF
jgi:hypothetical protein